VIPFQIFGFRFVHGPQLIEGIVQAGNRAFKDLRIEVIDGHHAVHRLAAMGFGDGIVFNEKIF
jgi:hypothetical protein